MVWTGRGEELLPIIGRGNYRCVYHLKDMELFIECEWCRYSLPVTASLSTSRHMFREGAEAAVMACHFSELCVCVCGFGGIRRKGNARQEADVTCFMS